MQGFGYIIFSCMSPYLHTAIPTPCVAFLSLVYTFYDLYSIMMHTDVSYMIVENTTMYVHLNPY